MTEKAPSTKRTFKSIDGTRTHTMGEIGFTSTLWNLRYRWKKELEPHSDERVMALYLEFCESEDHGDNDALFPEWFELL